MQLHKVWLLNVIKVDKKMEQGVGCSWTARENLKHKIGKSPGTPSIKSIRSKGLQALMKTRGRNMLALSMI